MKKLSDRMTSLYARLEWWAYRCTALARGQAGIENVEWVALAAVILVFLIAMMMVLKPGGTSIASQIISAITKWISKWTEGL